MVKDYGHLLAHDAAYAAKAKKIAELARDPIEIVTARMEEDRAADRDGPGPAAHRVPFAVHAAARACSIRGQVEEILLAIGHSLLPVADAHLCCGSAGTYSVLQPELAKQLQGEQADARSRPRGRT